MIDVNFLIFLIEDVPGYRDTLRIEIHGVRVQRSSSKVPETSTACRIIPW